MKKIVSVALCILMIMALAMVAFANTAEDVEVNSEKIKLKSDESKLDSEELIFLSTEESEEDEDVVKRATGVSEEMAHASYWKTHALGDADEIIMTAEEIKAKNTLFLSGETNMYDLAAMDEDYEYDADTLKPGLAGAIDTDLTYTWLNGEKITNEELSKYKEKLKTAINETGYTGTQKLRFAVGVKRTNIGCAPTSDFFGYNAADYDNELYSASIDVNGPFVILQMCTVDGNDFYWGYSNNCTGWVAGKDIAICKDKEEWQDAWEVDLEGKDFIVVTQDKIVLDPSRELTYASEVKLTLGTILKLVPEDEEKEIGERGEWNNYVVYLPTRNTEGKYEKKMALISEHCSVSVGFLPMTQANILDVAFSCLGNRYGWANAFDAMDCSGYTRTIYRCFGLEIPRNTTWQTAVLSTTLDVSTLDDIKKEKLIETLPIGSLLFFPGHITMYIGSENGINYVINDVSTLADTDTTKVLSEVNVIVNPLTVRRGASYGYTTWLRNITKIVIMPNYINLADCEVEVNHDRVLETFEVTLFYKGKKLTEDINYTSSMTTDPETKIATMTFTGINNCIGQNQAILDPSSPCTNHTVVTDAGIAATCTTPGLTEGSHCSVCGEVIIKQEIIPAFGHDWEERYTVDKMFTETEEGLMSIHCKNCDAVKNQMPIPKMTKQNPTPDPTKPVDTGDVAGKQIAFWILILICAGGIIFMLASTGLVMANGKKIYIKIIEKMNRK